MQILAAVAIIIGAIVGTILALLAVLAIRQSWRDGDVVEITAGETIIFPPQKPAAPSRGELRRRLSQEGATGASLKNSLGRVSGLAGTT
jgi:hypothetical protein